MSQKMQKKSPSRRRAGQSAAITLAAVGVGMILSGTQPLVAQVAQPVLKIGVLTDMSGPFSDSGGPGSVHAAQMAVEDFGGTLKGRAIEIISGDTLNKPDVASYIARSWFDTQGVSAIVDLPVTPVAFAVQEIAKEKKKTVMITAAAISDLTAKTCSPTSTHWSDDTHALAAGTASALVANGGGTWSFIAVDTGFGAGLVRDASEVIVARGGKILGVAKHPIGAADFSSLVLQSQATGAKVIGLATVGNDLINIIKQAEEFAIGNDGKQSLVGFLVFISDIHALGLGKTQNLLVTSGFYWDQNDKTRAFSKRFLEARKAMPTKTHAGVYSAVLHYLRAVDAAGTDEGIAVATKMRALPVDRLGTPGSVRADGRVLYDLTVYRVKRPSDSKRPWDYYEPVRTIPAAEAFLPANPACAQ